LVLFAVVAAGMAVPAGIVGALVSVLFSREEE
jgi:hypothetical protein